ncbi:MAG: L-histidine N(alpha)-methyltransferase [Paracoccaceae bacterium]|nr:L-histidine N(alpha)-methyltransferase [Paracoccaceae bacterium]
MSSSAADRQETLKRVAYFIDKKPAPADFLAEVLVGLSKSPKSVPPKFFYDEAGSDLFNKICKTPEYYVTRTEVALLETYGAEISRRAGPSRAVIEYGCGSSLKINALLDGLTDPAEYLAIDISKEHLLQTAADIAEAHPAVKVGAICADFSRDLDLPKTVGDGSKRLAFFPGSTIGNQTPEEAVQFLKIVRTAVGHDGSLLIGVDLEKDVSILTPAYNDVDGHTAAFNLNLLHRIRNELGGDLDFSKFRHDAFFNESLHRMEMHLVSGCDQDVSVGGQTFHFANQETIHTESSYKYSVDRFTQLAVRAGFRVTETWVDPDSLFSIHYLDASED